MGLRQIIDWVMMLDKKGDYIDMEMINRQLEVFHFSKEWNVFYTYAQVYLGLQGNQSLLSTSRSIGSKRQYRAIWQHCKTMGNMGHRDEQLSSANFMTRNIALLKKTHRKFLINSQISFPVAFKHILRLYRSYLRQILK